MFETDIKTALTQFFLDQFKVEIGSTDEDLIDAGVLDSLMLIEVVMFMETAFSVTTELDDLEMENFLTIDNMARFVAERQPAAGDAGPATATAAGAPQMASAAGKGGA